MKRTFEEITGAIKSFELSMVLDVNHPIYQVTHIKSNSVYGVNPIGVSEQCTVRYSGKMRMFQVFWLGLDVTFHRFGQNILNAVGKYISNNAGWLKSYAN